MMMTTMTIAGTETAIAMTMTMTMTTMMTKIVDLSLS
jgi:hypothetical protein